jgi:carbon monoxide dehydrogenase subunit G
MARLEESFRIHAPAETVWTVINDVEAWPEWTPSVKALSLAGTNVLGPGAEATIHLRGGSRATWRVTEYEPPRQFTWEATVMPGVKIIAGHRAEPDGDGARGTLWTETAGPLSPVFGWLLMRMGAQNVRDEAAGLKARSEAMTRGEQYVLGA